MKTTLTALTLTLLLIGGGSAFAQDEPAPDKAAETTPAAQDDKAPTMGFKAGGEVPKENLPGWPFLYGAYFFLWIIPLAYLFVMWRRQAALDAQLASLDKRLDALDAALDTKGD